MASTKKSRMHKAIAFMAILVGMVIGAAGQHLVGRLFFLGGFFYFAAVRLLME